MKAWSGLIVLFAAAFLLFPYCKNNSNDAALKNIGAEQSPQSNLSLSGISEDSNASVKENKKLTFIELGSVKCIPCRMMQPVMAEIKKEYPGRVNMVFYDVWTPEGRPYAQQYKIKVIPTQVFLDNEGKEYYRHEGFFPKEGIVEVLKMKGVQ